MLGLRNAREPEQIPPSEDLRIRRPGGVRKKVENNGHPLAADLDKLVDPVTRGDSMSALRWTSNSLRKLVNQLKALGHDVSVNTLRRLLMEHEYSLQGLKNTKEGGDHPDRDAQFGHISTEVRQQLVNGEPAVSVDTKREELVGDFKNGGRNWQVKGIPEEVRVHDFVLKELGKANPYGVYDVGLNNAWVIVGFDHDTAEFAVESILHWWHMMGKERYPLATRLLITTDGGGSNGSRVRLWKVALQKFADELGFPVAVCHLPSGTTKWKKLEQRQFSFITQNWRGRPLVSHQVILSLIGSTTTATGLKVRFEVDERLYTPGRKVSDNEMAQLSIKPHVFHGNVTMSLLPVHTHPIELSRTEPLALGSLGVRAIGEVTHIESID